MANQKQLKILKQGVETWRQWRIKNPNAEINLHGAHLSKANLRGAKLWDADLSKAHLSRADLSRANLAGSNLTEAHLVRANMKEAYLENAYLGGANLSKANLVATNFEGAFLMESKLKGADLNVAGLRGAHLFRADLSGACLRGVELRSADLAYAVLVGADLSLADLREADLHGADLRKAYFGSAKLHTANLTGADLQEADLRDAELMDANLINTNLTGAKFTFSRLGGTIFGLNDLSGLIDIEKAVHQGPSILPIETLYASKGKIPEVFLRGCGLSNLQIETSKLAVPGLDPEQLTDITYRIHQLYLGGGIQYYSCFISYNVGDKAFAKQLHDDLQNNGVRCWFAPDDLKIGDQIRLKIDQEIRLRDKLLVILSENSVKSEWVGDEVEAALEDERKSNRLILFPIRLDDTVMNARDDWSAKIKRRRHIGDFSNWKDKASYKKAFDRLLRDLKATGGVINGE